MDLSDEGLRKLAMQTVADVDARFDQNERLRLGKYLNSAERHSLIADIIEQTMIALRDAARAEQRELLDALVRWALAHSMGYLHCRLCGRHWYEQGGEPARHAENCPMPDAVKILDAAAIRASGA